MESTAEFTELINRWITDSAAYQVARDQFLQLRYEEDPTILIDELVALANQAARETLRRRPFPPEKR